MSKRDKIVIVVCLVVVFALCISSVKTYDNQKAQDYRASLVEHARKVEREQAKKLAIANEQNRIKQECEKGAIAYEALPARDRETKEAPNCDIQLLQ